MEFKKALGLRAVIGTLFLASALLALTTSLQGQEAYDVGGNRVAVYNLAGEVEVVRGSGSDVVVEVLRGGDDGAELSVEVSEIRGRQALRVIYPSDKVIYDHGGSTNLRVRDDGTFYDGRGGDRVEISKRGRGLEAWADLRISVPEGTEFELYLAVGTSVVEGLRSDVTVEAGSGSVDVRDIVGEVNVDTGSGSVDIQDVEGSVYADTGSGSVEVDNIAGGFFIADTGSGSVTGSRIDVRETSVDTGSGRIRLESLSSPEIKCDTGSGSVYLDLVTDIDRLHIDTGSGAVTVAVPGDFGAEIELDTGAGGIDLDVPAEVEQVRRNYFRGTIGDGRGDVQIDTGSGGIEIVNR